MVARLGLVLLVLLGGGCLGRGADMVAFDAAASVQLATTVRSGLFLTPVRIGGRDAGLFLIDTGAAVLIVDADLAHTLSLSIFQTFYDPGLRQTIRFASVSDLAVGPVTLRNGSAMIMSLTHFTSGLRERLSGILGYPFFESTVVEVDYGRRSVACADPARYQLPRGAWQTLILRDKRPGVSVKMDGGVEGVFLLDTGANTALSLSPHFVQKHRQELKVSNLRSRRSVHGDGEREIWTGEIAWLELNGRRIDRPSVDFEAHSRPASAESGHFDGIVGEGALRDFVVVFNYPAAKIAILPRDDR